MLSRRQHFDNLRICLSPGTLSTGGIGRNTLNLAAYYAQQGNVVDIIIMGAEKGDRLSEVAKNVNVIFVSARARYALIGSIKYINAKKPDLIISAHNNVNFVMVLAKTLSKSNHKTRLCCTFRTHRTTQLENGSFVGRIYDWLACKAYPHADKLVAVSQGVADDWNRSGAIVGKEMRVIYNPAWTQEVDELSRMQSTHKWLVKKDSVVIIAVGRLTKQKDFETLIRAFKIASSVRRLKLVILGEGEERQSLEELVSDLGLGEQVDLPGHFKNPYAEMRKSDLFVLSSAWEGFGNVVVEALGCGLSVVSTECPSGPAEILGHGHYGTLVEVGDTEGMARAILNSLNDPSDPERQEKRALEFSVRRAGEKYLELCCS